MSTNGLIPACAGKTYACGARESNGRAHPRVCGENSISARTKSVQSGSSPRVRGKREAEALAKDSSGLIPACAGKTKASGKAN